MRKYIYLTVFISGMTSLAAEFGASRLLGNIFGTSNIVWAVIIGLILLYLTAGYFIGGKWADRSPKPKTMYTILAWGAFSLGIIPFIATPVLRAAADAFDNLQVGVLVGAFIGVLVLFTFPITLMGMISPFAIRLSLDDASHAGNTAGKIYGISTIGSFIGTFLPTLVLIPTIGTTNTFLVISLVLLFTAIIGMFLSSGWKSAIPYFLMVILLVILAIFGTGMIKKTQGQIYETESSYNYIQVLEMPDGTRYLRLNEGQGVHSEYHPDHLNLAGPFFYEGKMPEDITRIAIVGLAAGTTARQAAAIFPNVVIDGWEIDPKIVQVGRDYFDMNLPNLNIYVQDGRWGLDQSVELYDLVVVDAYRPPYIPPHLTTQEFFQIAADHLKPDGALAINIGRAPGDRRLIDGLATTIGTIFPSIYVMDIPGTYNSILYATIKTTKAETLYTSIFTLQAEGKLESLLGETLLATWINLAPAPEVTTIFTDDRSPIEWMTNSLILNYLLVSGQEVLE
jgi:spermidine synthase